MSAASATATRSGSSARRIDSSAAIRTSTRRRTAASSVQRRARLLDVLQPAGRAVQRPDRRHGLVDRPTRRSRPRGPPRRARARRGRRATRSRSAGSDPGASATLTFAVAQPDATTIACARSGIDRGDDAVHRHPVAHRRRPALVRGLQRRREPGRRLRVVVLRERAELAPAGRTRTARPPATVIPRNRVVNADRVDGVRLPRVAILSRRARGRPGPPAGCGGGRRTCSPATACGCGRARRDTSSRSRRRSTPSPRSSRWTSAL